MAKKSKIRRDIKPAETTVALNPTPLKVKQITGTGKYVATQGMLGYGNVAFGDKQVTSTAPLVVPNGFATQIPYNSAINSTIIQNPTAIPVTAFYSIMQSDPVVYQCMLYMITTIIARIGDYNNEDKKCEKLIRRTLKRIGKNKLYQAILTSLWAGFAAIKLNWGNYTQSGEFEAYIDEEGYTAIESITVLPPDSVMLAVTPPGELDPDFGVMQYYYNLNSEWNQNGKAFSNYGNSPFAAFSGYMSPQRQVAFNPMYLSAIPEDWRIFHSFNPTGLAGNHFGTSMIKSIFGSIVDKNNVLMKIQVAATFKAAPLVWIDTDTQTEVQTESGEFISKAKDIQQNIARGATTGYYINEGMNSVKITTINNTADIKDLADLVNLYNTQIRNGLCTPDLTGNAGSYANAMANNDSNDSIINNITLHVIDTLMSQFVKLSIDKAIGVQEDYGHFELLDNSLNDKAIWAKILESGKNLGVIDPKNLDDVNFLRKRIGMAPVSKLSEDMIFGMMGYMDSGNVQGSNIAKNKELIKEPYANGMDKKQNARYGKDSVA